MLKIVPSFVLKFEAIAAGIGIVLLYLLQVVTPDPFVWSLSIAGALITVVLLAFMALGGSWIMVHIYEQVRRDYKDRVHALEEKVSDLEKRFRIEQIDKDALVNQLENAIEDLEQAHNMIRNYERRLGANSG